MSEINFGKYVVKAGGAVDIQGTIDKFQTELTAWLDLQERDQSVLLTAIEEVFAENAGATLNTPAVQTLALTKVGFTANNYQALRERCVEVMKSNPRYYTIKGKGGGVRRMSDAELAHFESTGQTPTDVEKAAKEAKKNAKK